MKKYIFPTLTLTILGAFLAAARVFTQAPAPAPTPAPPAPPAWSGIFPIPLNQRAPMPLPAANSPLTYPVVYLKAPKTGVTPGVNPTAWPSVGNLFGVVGGSSIWIHYPDGTDKALTTSTGTDGYADLAVSFDGQWVYYTYYQSTGGGKSYAGSQFPAMGGDVWKINVATGKKVQLTFQTDTPNSQTPYNALPLQVNNLNVCINMHPCPLPGGRFAFVSTRNGYNANGSFLPQLFAADDDTGKNVEQIGFLNLSGALHPVCLQDGRILFSTKENQGRRNSSVMWGTWVINPDGTHWNPCFAALAYGVDGATLHFQTQLSGGEVVQCSYYETNSGFGTILACQPQQDNHAFGSSDAHADPRNLPLPNGMNFGNYVSTETLPFSPYGLRPLIAFTSDGDGSNPPFDINNPTQGRVGKFSHPAAAPNNGCLLTHAFQMSPDNKSPTSTQIVLVPTGATTYSPGQTYLIVPDDGTHFVYWPRALTSYQTLCGMAQPKQLAPLANDGSVDKNLPAGTPYALVGTSSFYKREAFPGGVIQPGSVTSTYADPKARWWSYASQTANAWYQSKWNFSGQGAECGPFDNSKIHALRILAQEPTTSYLQAGSQHPWNQVGFKERLRILGEIPLRKFDSTGKQILDPDGNPDTSMLAKVPADTSVKFQLLDEDAMVLADGQTWHQFRPGEKRQDCGGCHAHSQKPTDITLTVAGQASYTPWDLTDSTRVPLLTNKAGDQSKQQWDANNATGLLYASGRQSPEFLTDVKPILNVKCVFCHTTANAAPPGSLTLDDAGLTAIGGEQGVSVDTAYFKLVMDGITPENGFKPPTYGPANSLVKGARRYIPFAPDSRNSPLVWKLFGQRFGGTLNADWPYEATPGDPTTLTYNGAVVAATDPNLNALRKACAMPLLGTQMPPPANVAAGTAQALTDTELRTIVRWIGLCCPCGIGATGPLFNRSWKADTQGPTLTIQSPALGTNANGLTVLRIGAADYYPGLAAGSLSVKADFVVDGQAAGTELAPLFTSTAGVYTYSLKTPITALASGNLSVSVKDQTGNSTSLTRTFSVSGTPVPPPPPPANGMAQALQDVSAALASTQKDLAALQAAVAEVQAVLQQQTPPMQAMRPKIGNVAKPKVTPTAPRPAPVKVPTSAKPAARPKTIRTWPNGHSMGARPKPASKPGVPAKGR